MEPQQQAMPGEHHRHEEHREHEHGEHERQEHEHRDEGHRREEHHEKHKVKITINQKDYEMRPGIISVAELKRIAGIEPTEELEEVREGVLVPLPDNGSVDIKGCEVFVSHPRDGHSS